MVDPYSEEDNYCHIPALEDGTCTYLQLRTLLEGNGYQFEGGNGAFCYRHWF